MKKICVIAIMAFSILAVVGCFTLPPIRTYSGTTDMASLEVGMSSRQVVYLMGNPDKINYSMVDGTYYDQWIYEVSPHRRAYLYFRDGKLTSWQH